MTGMVFVVSDCCPVGCGVEVVVLRARTSLIAYCYGCACTFSTPAGAQLAAGLNEVRAVADAAPDGVELPNEAEIVGTLFEGAVLRGIRSSEWGEDVDQVNAAIQRVHGHRG